MKSESIRPHPSVGLTINQFQSDFGLGLAASSPCFFNRRVAIRASANVQWLQHVAAPSMETQWSAYAVYKLGVAGIGAYITPAIRAYGEGGLALIQP